MRMLAARDGKTTNETGVDTGISITYRDQKKEFHIVLRINSTGVL